MRLFVIVFHLHFSLLPSLPPFLPRYGFITTAAVIPWW